MSEYGQQAFVDALNDANGGWIMARIDNTGAVYYGECVVIEFEPGTGCSCGRERHFGRIIVCEADGDVSVACEVEYPDDPAASGTVAEELVPAPTLESVYSFVLRMNDALHLALDEAGR